MMPRIEDLLAAELGKRICKALPETAPGTDEENESFTVSFETRRFMPCLQEQENLIVYGEVTAEIAVIFYSQKERLDYTPLYVSIARNPYIKLAEGISACISMEKCEAIEGPYISNDAWLFKAIYHIFDIKDVTAWQPP